MVQRLGELGFTQVYNECEDFYAAVKSGAVPEHDVVVTNPPYSGEHLKKLLSFCAGNGKPFFLLMPHFVYTKDYYAPALTRHKNAGGGVIEPFYVVPMARRYAYTPPSWVTSEGSTAVGRLKPTTAPFPSFW